MSRSACLLLFSGCCQWIVNAKEPPARTQEVGHPPPHLPISKELIQRPVLVRHISITGVHSLERVINYYP